ncbi:MAG: terminase family protein [Geminicoccaceae bacterium]
MSAAVPLHAYQRSWLQDDARFKIGMFARQTGKTFTTTLEIVDDCFAAAVEGRRERWVILSRGERQAKEAMDEGVKRHAKAYEMAFEEASYDWVGGAGSYRAVEVELPGGSKITALPANPDTARGYSANVFLDEFAIHADSRAIWGALFPVVSKPGLRLRITSTPKGKGNKFYELMTSQDGPLADAAGAPQPRGVWSKHQVDIYQAVADGLPRDIEELRRAVDDEDVWAQEFELKWLDEAESWLSFDLITACEHDDAGNPDLYQGGPVWLGNDIARRRDLWVLWVLEQVGDVLWARELIERRGISFAEQDAILDETVRRYRRTMRIAMDQTGMGEKPVEDAKRRHGESRVEGVLLTGARRLDLATIGKQRFQDRRIRIPAGSTALRADLHRLKKVVGPTGAPRLVAERDGADHADRTWALFLAAGAAEGAGGEIDFRAAGDRRAGLDAFGQVQLPGRDWDGPRERPQRGFGTVPGSLDFGGFA